MPSSTIDVVANSYPHRYGFDAPRGDRRVDPTVPGIRSRDAHRVADLVVPEYESAELGSPDLSEVVPTERRADAVVTLNQDGRAVLGIVVEVQLGRDSDKTYSWPSYDLAAAATAVPR